MPPKKAESKITVSKKTESKSSVSKNTDSYILVIVESPGKIKKIESILGPGYIVMSSYGHIMDLHPKKLSVDIENGFAPEYHIMTGKKKFEDKNQVVNDLIAKAKKASKVILAADSDREGEMIAWSYMQALGLKEDQYQRITFTSITKEDVKKAILNPGKIDQHMVDSQKTRRIMDRLVGFEISPRLTDILGIRNLSAGRVQSIVNKLICEKENEVESFLNSDQSSHYKITGTFVSGERSHVGSHELKCTLVPRQLKKLLNDNQDNDNQDNENQENENDDENENTIGTTLISKYSDAENLMINFSNSSYQIHQIIVKESLRRPAPPFTTSSVQQEASSKLRFPIKKTMSILQKLYEAGYTTYLRTDSTNLSEDALEQCEKYVSERFGSEYHKLTRYTNDKENTQEAHEAIRPVDIKRTKLPTSEKIGADEQKMYDLVWNRTLGSQMSHCKVNVNNIYIAASKDKRYFFKTKIDDVVFPGYKALDNIGTHGQAFDKMREGHCISVPKLSDYVDPHEIQCNEQ
jgi:DNA topoisomerase I